MKNMRSSFGSLLTFAAERRTDEKIDRRADENERPTFSRREERTRADWKERPNVLLAISKERRPYE
jgi:hypothetical protein